MTMIWMIKLVGGMIDNCQIMSDNKKNWLVSKIVMNTGEESYGRFATFSMPKSMIY